MRPKVICHIMGSVDGRVLVHRWSEPFGGVPKMNLLKVYSEIGHSLHTDAWTFGKNTIAEIFPEKYTCTDGEAAQSEVEVFRAKRISSRMFISIDPDADIRYTSNIIRGDSILAVMDRRASAEYLGFLRSMDISYLMVPDISDLGAVLDKVNQEFGIASVSLQGGGVLNAAMLNAGVIDELSLVLYPGIDGMHESVSIFDYMGDKGVAPAGGQSLELVSVEKREYGVVWLRYSVHRSCPVL